MTKCQYYNYFPYKSFFSILKNFKDPSANENFLLIIKISQNSHFHCFCSFRWFVLVSWLWCGFHSVCPCAKERLSFLGFVESLESRSLKFSSNLEKFYYKFFQIFISAWISFCSHSNFPVAHILYCLFLSHKSLRFCLFVQLFFSP